MGESSIASLTLKQPPVKFLCSYGGRILPRYPDGKLRYHGGHTRVLAVDVSISFAELVVKMGKLCGSTVTVTLRCQLPAEDLDALVSITSDEDLANLIEEYDCAASAAVPPPSFKMRVFLSGPKTIKTVSPPPSPASYCSSDISPPKSPLCPGGGGGGLPPRYPVSATRRFAKRSSMAPAYPIVSQEAAGKIRNQFGYQYYIGQGNGCGLFHLIHNGNICQ